MNKENMVKRLKKKKKLNRYDKFNYNFYKKVQNGFLKLSKRNIKKYTKIDSNLNITENKKKVIKKIVGLI